MRHLHFILTTLLILTAATYTACSDDESNDQQAPQIHDDYHNANGPTEGVSYVRTEAGCNSSEFAQRLEMPRLQQDDIFIVHQVNDMAGKPVNYSVAYVAAQHHSRWVAFRFDSAMKGRSAKRKDYNISPQYPSDPLCPATTRDDASFRGYDHGHLCASADRLCSREANDQTFYMSNMSPQGSSFNQYYWTKYEGHVQGLADNVGATTSTNTSFADTLYVVKGGRINDVRNTIKIDGYNMTVPTHYFIALLKVKNGSYASIGFWVEHKSYNLGEIKSDKAELAAHAVSIDELEQLTGIDFFCNLPGAVEKAVESSFSLSAWQLQ